MAAYAEGWMGVCYCDCIFKRGAIRHQGCRGEDACGVELADGAIDSGSEAEVVGVEDKMSWH